MEVRTCRLHRAHDLRIDTETLPAMGPDDVQVAVRYGGICGSDLHYFHDGGIGNVRVREPIVVGHEAAGHILAVGTDVDGLADGDPVAINPSRHCGSCRFCDRMDFNHCLNMRFMGSAATLPHEQGLFREIVTLPASQVHPLSRSVSLMAAACTEPLAVCLHAAARAPDLEGSRVLIAGAGPIGCLMTAVVARANPTDLVVTDMHDNPLAIAATLGAKTTLNISTHPERLESYGHEQGQFDTAFACTGAAAAIKSALSAIRPQGTLVMVGMAGTTPLPLNVLVKKELRLLGSHRFHVEFAAAVGLIDTGQINIMPIISHIQPLDNAMTAFPLAGDRTRSLKVLLSMTPEDREPAYAS